MTVLEDFVFRVREVQLGKIFFYGFLFYFHGPFTLFLHEYIEVVLFESFVFPTFYDSSRVVLKR